jgi:Ca2+-transporting ATPase
MRDGELVQVPSRTLVPGDIVRVEAGDRVPADGVLVSGRGVMVDESVLTGESVPVEKAVEAELFSGTLIVRGKVVARVAETGAASAMGRISAMLAGLVTERTPLERRMDALGAQIARWISALAVILIIAGLATEGLRRLDEVVMFAVALAVAAIPEGMPAVVTLTLALGVQRMATRNALVRRMAAVESLGSVTLIATDKTGTLTLNQMTVVAAELADREQALRGISLANDANLRSGVGDPLDLALLEYARDQGVDVEGLQRAYARVDERPFDSAWRFMRATVQVGATRTSYLKGAPEALLTQCGLSREELEGWRHRADEAARQGYRVLAVAAGEGHREEALSLLGLVMLWDPPRPEVASALAKARRAGVRVVIITGDHAATAGAVAAAIGLPREEVLTGDAIDGLSADALRLRVRDVDVFARVSPAHKLRLVEAFRDDGHIVAMTGDGVNDAPALKRADVGVAMGKRGSDVAREVADLVLLDDNFATIVAAIEEGRGIYENIQSFIRFTFSTNVALMVLVVTGAAAAYAEGLRDAAGMLLVPLTAVQLLWINFLGDGPPALALAVDRTPGHMDRPPRPPSSALLDRASATFILGTGAIKGAIGIALLVFMPALGYGVLAVRTVLFLYESVGKLVSVYPSRRLVRGRRSNVPLHAAVIAGTLLQILTVAIPGLRQLLGIAVLDLRATLLVTASVIVTWLAATAMSALANSPRGPGRQHPGNRILRHAAATR